MHGITINEITSGTRALVAAATSIIGLVATAPAAQAEVKSKLLTGVVASNTGQTFTSKLTGTAGDAISLALVDPAANSSALAITVTGTAISVSLATNNTGAITTTATALATAIAGNAAANALVGVANTAGSSGAGVLAASARKLLSGGVNQAFPAGKLTLVTDVRRAITLAGATGTLKTALQAISDSCSPVIVVSTVAVDAENQDDLTAAGVEALLGAQSLLGVKPKILGAPGLDTQEVVVALGATARKLDAMAYFVGDGDDYAEAQDYRQNFGARELMMLWPTWSEGATYTAAHALGHRARIDEEQGWHKTISNVACDGPTGIAKAVSFDVQSGDTDAALLNASDITTMIRHNGFRYWGNRTCSDEPLYAFESTVRTAQVLKQEIGEGLMWAIDKPLTQVLIKDIIETINARFRALIAQGRLIGAKAWYDPAHNEASALKAGKLVVDWDFTDVAPLEDLTGNQRITDRYYAEGFGLLAA